MTEFSMNQGVYAQNMPTSLYPFISEDAFSNFVGFPSYGGFKYPTPLSAKPLNYPAASPSLSQHPSFSGNIPPGRKPKQGRGGKPPSQNNRYNANENSNNGNPEGNGSPGGRTNQPSVTLDIRGGGYKMESTKRRPYKAPSVDSGDRGGAPRRPPSHGGRGNGNSGQRPRNKRPNQKSRHRGPTMKNPYFNMKYEVSMPSLSQNIEFENPENVLPPLSPSMLMQFRQQKGKFNPYLYGNFGDVINPSLMQAFFTPSAFNSLKSVPGFYDSVKSAASQLLRGRKTQSYSLALTPTSQLSQLGLGLSPQSPMSATSQLASQLALLQSNAEKQFGSLPQLGNEFLAQDQALYSALSKTQGGRSLLAQIQQQQMQAMKSLHSSPLFQQHLPQNSEPGGPLNQYLASLDQGSSGNSQESGFGSTHATNYQSGTQGGEHAIRSSTGLSHPNSQTSHAVDYQQMLLQQYPPQNGYPSHSNLDHVSQQGQGQSFLQKGNYPSGVPHEAHQGYNTQHASKENINMQSQFQYNPLDSVSNQEHSDYYGQQGHKHAKDPHMQYADVNPSLHAYSSDSKIPYQQITNYPPQGDYQQPYNDPNEYKGSSYPVNNGQFAAHANDKTHLTPTSGAGNQPPYSSYPTTDVGNMPYPQDSYHGQLSGSLQHGASGQDTAPVYSPSGQKHAANYPTNFMSLYQQFSSMPNEPKFGFPAAVPTGSGNTEAGGHSGQKQGTVPQNINGRDRAAVHLPDDMSVFVSHNAQDKYMYQNYPEIYGQQSYYYQDPDQTASDLDSSESENEEKDNKGRAGGDGMSGKKKNSASRVSDNIRNSKKSGQRTKAKAPDSSSSSRSSQPVWTTTTSSSKIATSEEKRDQKAKNPSSYMIEYSPMDPTETKAVPSSNTQSPPVQKSPTAKPDNRKYHSPVPAQTTNKSSSKASPEKKKDEDYPFCARYTNTTYCLQDPEYPKDEIKDAIEKNRHPMDHFLVDISASSNAMEDPKASSLSYSFEGNVVSSSSNDINNATSGCPSKVYYSKPLRAINTSGQWKIIVNIEFGETGANYTQTVRLEECISQKDGAPSSCGGELISACIQQYKLYRLLSWEKDKGFSIDAFLLPISCLCGNTISATTTST